VVTLTNNLKIHITENKQMEAPSKELFAPATEVVYELVTSGGKKKYYSKHAEEVEVVFENGQAMTVEEVPDGSPSGKPMKSYSDVRLEATTLQDLRDVREGRSSSLEN
jgi:hypothetical protein